MSDSELACVYSALILHDAGVPITVSGYFCVQFTRQSDAYLAQSLVWGLSIGTKAVVYAAGFVPNLVCVV